MRHFLAASILLVTSGCCLEAAAARGPQGADAAAFFAAYRAGDYDVIRRSIPSRASWADWDGPLFRLAETWKSEAEDRGARVWNGKRVAFLVEVANAVRPFELGDCVRLLNAARDIVILRPGLPGAENGVLDEGDHFEVAAHRLALAILFPTSLEARSYLRSIVARLVAFRRSEPGARLISRLDLTQILLLESDSRPFVRDSSYQPTGRVDERPLTAAFVSTVSPTVQERDQLVGLLKAFPAPGGVPEDVAAELDVRRGLTLYRLTRYDESLAAISGALARAGEPSVRHWGLLFQGRVFEALGRVDSAIQSYEDAIRLTWPRAQTAATTLAAALFLKGDRSQAEAWARMARTMTMGEDPWWEYWYGDQRYSRALLTELRSAGP